LSASPAIAGTLGLGERNPQRHPVLVEEHHEHAQRMTGDLLRLNADNLADPVGRIHNEIASGEWNFIRGHIRLS